MILKTNWEKHLHTIRAYEIKKIIDMLPRKYFKKGIEFGAGDGYQTSLFAPYFENYVSTDLNFKRIKDSFKIASVTYLQCDADNIPAALFEKNSFDIVFSSNLIEHLSNPEKFLCDTKALLVPEGFAVHVVPGRLVKVSYLGLFYLNLLVLILDRLVGIFFGKKIFRGSKINLENNINTKHQNRLTNFERFFLPRIHGNYPTHYKEFYSWGKHTWIQLFENNGFKLVAYGKGKVFSGYGFGFNILRIILEKIGLFSEHIFVFKKNDIV